VSVNPHDEPAPVRICRGDHVKIARFFDARIASESHQMQADLDTVLPEPPKARIEPSVKVIEGDAGIFEIIVTCSCGERTVVRCHLPPTA